MKKNVTLGLLAISLIMSSCNTTGDSENLLPEDTKISGLAHNKAVTIDDVAKQIVEVSSRITINEGIIEGNQERFFADLNNGVLFTSDYTTFSEFGQVFQDYFGISKTATEDLFTIFYDNRELISQVDPEGKLLAEAIAREAEAYNAANPTSAQNKIIFGVLVSIINPKGCGWGVAAGVADTAASAVLTAVTSPTGAGAVVGAISTAGFYADTVVKAARCKK